LGQTIYSTEHVASENNLLTIVREDVQLMTELQVTVLFQKFS